MDKRKRTILMADDEFINREILGEILKDRYDVLFAENGRETMDRIREHGETLSLVLLDLIMPEMHGTEVLRCMKADPVLSRIPVIVMTSDQALEVECLQLGAVDFIPKPYPQKEVILARIQRTIELSEDRDIIRSTERDSLTGLYNREFFYRYAEQLDLHHREMSMDAIVLDINHFHMINERYGRASGDEVLRSVAGKLKDIFSGSGGIVCRKEADTFLVYSPHREDYREILERASAGMIRDESISGRVRLRMGVYSDVDKTIDMERRFDRAKSASDTVRGSFASNLAVYDRELYESEMFSEQLLEEFHEAVRQKQFKVFYQPKFDIRPEIPVLTSAEALVRWEHPTLGMISPGVFIPLFEKNGLIGELDNYVWRESAARIRDWKDRLGFSVPVSVNVSRVDMYDPNLVNVFLELMEEYSLTPKEFLLEITESAYTQDSEQMISVVSSLRELGFRIEMDDFGTGYSSLNMISSLPIDALKLDMQFIRNAFQGKKDTGMLEVILEIADHLSVPVIAEGVETEEQLYVLKAMGCDIVQGYYFSRPVPPEKYEVYVEQRKGTAHDLTDEIFSIRKEQGGKDVFVPGEMMQHALSGSYERIFYADLNSGHYVEFEASGPEDDLQILKSGEDFNETVRERTRTKVLEEDRESVEQLFRPEYLTEQLKKKEHVSLIYRRLEEGTPVYCSMRIVSAGSPGEGNIIIGISNVNELVKKNLLDNSAGSSEERRLRYSRITRALAADYFCIYYVDTETDRFIEYSAQKNYRDLGIEAGGDDFFKRCEENLTNVVWYEDQDRLRKALKKETLLEELKQHRSFTINYRLMLDGVPTYVSLKASGLENPSDGHIIIGVSNIDAQMKREEEYERALGVAKEQVNRDALTGVKSKHAYDDAKASLDRDIAAGKAEPFAVAMCDVNDLKKVNDTFGHNAGDQLLKTACAIICNTFKHSPVFRIGGDEFVAILRGLDYESRAELRNGFLERNIKALEADDVVVACGIADFLPGEDTSMSAVFERADAEMYRNKKELKIGRQ
ncbi:MAG: EAL domain-containing protein [Stomatobaculum sp.]|nr:EAL domain-containing protein [Stomatobaculum sp.]